MYKILLVDDQESVRRELRNLISWQESGFELVAEARDGDEALTLLESIKCDLVVTDIRMPLLDGLGLLKEIKEQYPQLLVIFLSDYGEFNLAKEAIEYGLFAYLTKPPSKAEIRDVLEKSKKYLDSQQKSFAEELQSVFSAVTTGDLSYVGRVEHLEQKILSSFANKEHRETVKRGILRDMEIKIVREYIWVEKFPFRLPEKNFKEAFEYFFTLLNYYLVGFGKNPYINEICEYVLVNIDKQMSLEEIAKSMFLSKHYIGELFKGETKLGLKDYMIHMKVERAKHLLRSTSLKWYEVVNFLGYSNVGYFTIVFKEKTGLTPQQYRKQFP